jgi:hypothetical protein
MPHFNGAVLHLCGAALCRLEGARAGGGYGVTRGRVTRGRVTVGDAWPAGTPGWCEAGGRCECGRFGQLWPLTAILEGGYI